IEEGKLEAERTPLGAFRIPAHVVARERDRRVGSAAIAPGRGTGRRPKRTRTGAVVIATVVACALGLGLALGISLRPDRDPSTTGSKPPMVPTHSQQVVLLIDPPPADGLVNPRGELVDAFV